jgi:hypothetical protein
MRKNLVTLAVIVCLTPFTSIAAPVPLSSANPDVGSWLVEPLTNQTWGWFFTVLEPLAVTNVGWYDENGDGLSHSHQIGLWAVPTTQGAPVQLLGNFNPPTGIVIPSGTAAQLDGPWRKMPLPDGAFTLPIGNYILGGTNNSASTDHVKYTFGKPLIQLDPRVTGTSAGFSQNAGFNPPDQFFLVGDAVEFGPMLFVLPVPEPSTCGLALVSASILIARGFRSGDRKTFPSAH